MTTHHLLLALPKADLLTEHTHDGDHVWALNLLEPVAPLQRESARALHWHTTSHANDDNLASARTAYLNWLKHIAATPIGPHASLKSWLQVDEHLSVWWFTRTSERGLRTNALPQLALKLHWLQSAQAQTSLAALKDARAVNIWAADHASAQAIAQALLRHQLISAAKHIKLISAHDGQGLSSPQPQPDDLASRIKRRAISVGSHAKAVAAAHKAARTHHDDTSAHAALTLNPTFASDWHIPQDGAATHRYLQECADTLAQAQQPQAWLPLYTIAGSADTLTKALERQDQRVAWRAAALPWRRYATLLAQLRKLQSRYDAHRHTLFANPAFTFAGVDLSAWIIQDLDKLIDTDALKHLLIRAITAQATQQLTPSLILYRDEFYTLGRAISASKQEAPNNTRYWSMQHGTITDDHWTYFYSGQELNPPYALPAPDKFLVYGQDTLKRITQYGLPETKLTITGSLRHDAMFARALAPERSKHELRASLNLPQDRPIYLICTQLISQIPGWIERLVHALNLAKLNAHIAIKQHHFHRADDLIKQTFQDLGFQDYSIHTQNLESLLQAADASLTENSTTGLESIIWGTPLICFGEDERYESYPYISSLAALPARSAQQLAESLNTVNKHDYSAQWAPIRQEFLTTHMANSQSPAAAQLLNLLKAHLNVSH